MGYNFKVQYRRRVENRAADALSRKVHFVELGALTMPRLEELDALDEETKQDVKLQKLIHDILRGTNDNHGYHLKKRTLFYKDRLVISKFSSHIPKFLLEFHATPSEAHSGFFHKYKHISSVLHQDEIKQDVQRFVAECDGCHKNRYAALSPIGLLQSSPILSQVWDHITMDFITRLPNSGGYDTMLVVIDRFSKFAHFIPIKHPHTAKDIANVFLREIVKLHGYLKSTVTDHDRVFISHFWSERFKSAGTK